MQNLKLLVATLVITLGLVFGVGWVLSNMFSSTSGPSAPGMTVDQSQLVSATAQVKGASESAQFTIVEFSDFQCPACAATEPALSALVEQYPDKVRLVYRHFPLISIHPNATLAARYAEAAGKQGKFWEMHDGLFATQIEWSDLSNDEAREYFLSLGDQLSLDRTLLTAAADSDEIVNLVSSDLRTAEQLQLTFTPSIFLNGELMDVAEVQQAIQAGVTADNGAMTPDEAANEQDTTPTIDVTGPEETAPGL